MHTIICQDDTGTIVEKMQEYLGEGSMIKGMHLVDRSNNQVVLLIAEKTITAEMASIWWQGYQAALG